MQAQQQAHYNVIVEEYWYYRGLIMNAMSATRTLLQSESSPIKRARMLEILAELEIEQENLCIETREAIRNLHTNIHRARV